MKKFVASLLCSFSLLSAGEIETQTLQFGKYPVPWFTGPLLTSSGAVVPLGHCKLQPYLNLFVRVGEFDAHWHSSSVPNFYDLNLRIQTKFGILPRMDFQITPHIRYQETRGQKSFGLGDTSFNLNLQILAPQTIHGGPYLRLALRAIAPTGKYQRLNPDKLRTDKRGNGSWYPGASLILSKMWHISGLHYIELRSEYTYHFGTPVCVHGENAYGGDPSTYGTVYPGNYYFFETALQYNLTQNWALACDFRYEHHNRDRFSGTTTDANGDPSSEDFSLAPAIEYNFSKQLGLVGGVWFNVAGRNTHQFVNGMLSFVAYF